MKRIIVAFDGISPKDAIQLAETLAPEVWGFKLNDLLVECGVEIVTRLKQFGNVFADAKFYDIPNTVKNGVRRLNDAGADLITVHGSGGIKMMRAAVENATSAKILAVTALTSLSSEETQRVYQRTSKDLVLHLAALALNAGVFGLVCSPEELAELAATPSVNSLKFVTPGVRPNWHNKPDDQTRVSTPAHAIRSGAHLLVIGRPILEAFDPLDAARRINAELRG